MTTTGSVSKGVFAFKGKKSAVHAEDYFHDGGPDVFCQKRKELCDDLWEQISEKIQVLQSDLNSKIFGDLVEYVKEAHSQFSTKGQGHHKVIREIPTAALVTGVNMPDHALMFGQLLMMLRESVTPHVAVLQSKDCTNMKSIMIKTVTAFMGNTNLMLDDSDEEEIVNIKKVQCNMSVLASWYKERRQRTPSPKKRKSVDGSSRSQQCPPLVVMLEDFEGFPPHVLQDFISICSNYLSQLPLVLVFGIATTVTAVHRILPHAVSSLLCMEKFQAPPSSDYLNQVISQVVMTSSVPFKFGSRVFQLLLDLFLFHDFSVINFIRGLQFCILEHFQSSSYSFLCQPLEGVVDCIKKMKHSDVEELRKTKSFRRHVEKSKPAEQIALLEDDKYTKQVIAKFLADIDSYHESYFPVLRCLHVMAGNLPGYPLGKQLRELYCLSLSKAICTTEDYSHAISLIRTMSRDELSGLLSRCIDILSDPSVPDNLTETRECLQQISQRFINITDPGALVEEPDEDEVETESALPKKTDMYTLRQKLQEMEKRKKKLTVYEQLRKDAVDFLDALFRQYLLCPKDLPLHEVVYYDNLAEIKQHLNGSPRATIQTALNNPYYYLQNDGLLSELGAAWEALPDLCIVYKLHLECGRLINLYDWLQAFIMIVDDQESSKSSGKGKNKTNTVLQARFIRAVSELQFLGFIKSTKRKTDHVARLTWGGC